MRPSEWRASGLRHVRKGPPCIAGGGPRRAFAPAYENPNNTIVDPVTNQDVSQLETSPSRRNRLRMVKALSTGHTNAVEYFVVADDVDLTDLEPEGWTHYHPWEFVPAAAADETPVAAPDSTPFTDTPAPRATDERDIHPAAFDPRELR